MRAVPTAPLVLMLAAALLLPACESTPATVDDAPPRDHAPQATPTGDDASISDVPAPSPSIAKIELFATPAALNWDDEPGADGVRARFYLFGATDPLAVGLQRGVLEFVIYQGRVVPQEVASAEPFHTWRYSAGRLRPYASKAAVGVGYALSLDWGERVPPSDTITFTIRLLRPNQPPLYALPIVLSMGVR